MSLRPSTLTTKVVRMLACRPAAVTDALDSFQQFQTLAGDLLSIAAEFFEHLGLSLLGDRQT